MKSSIKIKIGNATALISFLMGTALFISFLMSENDNLLIIGFFYVIIASILNTIILFWLRHQTSDDSFIRKKLNRSKRFIITNIPIATGYLLFIMYFLSCMRITFINNTGEVINNMQIIGCENETINQIDTNHKKTKWIGAYGDCSVEINYFINGEEKQETVVIHSSGLTGYEIEYEIGSNKPVF